MPEKITLKSVGLHFNNAKERAVPQLPKAVAQTAD
jgi:hypothetical protein